MADEIYNEQVPEGVYSGTYQGSEETTINSKRTNTMEKVLRHFWKVEVNGLQITADCLSDVRYAPTNRYGKIVKALTGRDLAPLERLSVDKLMGKPATLIFETHEGRTRLVNILPPKATPRSAKNDVESFL